MLKERHTTFSEEFRKDLEVYKETGGSFSLFFPLLFVLVDIGDFSLTRILITRPTGVLSVRGEDSGNSDRLSVRDAQTAPLDTLDSFVPEDDSELSNFLDTQSDRTNSVMEHAESEEEESLKSENFGRLESKNCEVNEVLESETNEGLPLQSEETGDLPLQSEETGDLPLQSEESLENEVSTSERVENAESIKTEGGE